MNSEIHNGISEKTPHWGDIEELSSRIANLASLAVIVRSSPFCGSRRKVWPRFIEELFASCIVVMG
jgi:hypothetical protein